MKHVVVILFLFFSLLPSDVSFAQDAVGNPPLSYTVITHAGDTLTGSFERWAGDTLLLRNDEGEILRVRRTDFSRVDESTAIRAEMEINNDSVAEAFGRTPASSLILFPTAWPKPDGHPVVGLYEFAFVSASVSFADLVTFSGMTSFVNLFSGDGDIYSIGMKFSPVMSDNVALAAGVCFLEGYNDHVRPVQLLHVTGSFMLGDISLTAGYVLVREEHPETGSVSYLGFDIPVTEFIRILLEFAKPEEYGRNQYLFGAAARLQHRRLLLELGAFGEPDSRRAFIAPWIGLGFIL